MTPTPEFVVRTWFEDLWNKRDRRHDRPVPGSRRRHSRPATQDGKPIFLTMYQQMRVPLALPAAS